jgi:hypothetical protein
MRHHDGQGQHRARAALVGMRSEGGVLAGDPGGSWWAKEGGSLVK